MTKIFWIIQIIILVQVIDNVSGKEIPICILGRKLKDLGIEKIGEWMCTISKESDLYSDMIVYNNGSISYGLFQIPDSMCTYGKVEKKCNADCKSFLNSDFTDDYECSLKIIAETGYSNWKSWNYCNENPYKYKGFCISFD